MTLKDLIHKLFRQVNESSGGEISVCCPFCREIVGKADYKFRLGINASTGVGHCFRCEKKHSAKGGKKYWFKEFCRVFKVNYHLDIGERDEDGAKIAQSRLHAVANGDVSKKVAVKLPAEYEPLWKNVNDAIGRKARRYLISRGISEDQIKKHRIGFCAVGKYAHRIIFPVYSAKGKLKAFVARDFSGVAEYRYLNSEGAKTLYNVPRKRNKVALLVEGIVDVLAAERALVGVDPIAGLGKTLTKSQLRILAKYQSVVIWPDPDRPGVEGAIKRATALRKRKVFVAIVLPDEDIETDVDLGKLGETSLDEIRERYVKAVPYTPSVAALMRIRVSSASSPKKKKGTNAKV